MKDPFAKNIGKPEPPATRVATGPVDSSTLRHRVQEEMWSHFSLDDDENANWFIANIEEPLLALICHYEGHVVIDDQCMRPDHRYCVVCGARQANEPLTDDPFQPTKCPRCGLPLTRIEESKLVCRACALLFVPTPKDDPLERNSAWDITEGAE